MITSEIYKDAIKGHITAIANLKASIATHEQNCREYKHPPSAIVLGATRIYTNQLEQLAILEKELEEMKRYLERK